MNADIFLSRVAKSDGCWLWLGAVNKTRLPYGFVKVDGVMKYAHRVSYEYFVGPIPDGLILMHICDVPQCVRPDHLVLGTHKKNAEDRNRKNRHCHGERHPDARLTDQIVRDARCAFAEGEVSVASLARKYGVTRRAMRLALGGKTWAHV